MKQLTRLALALFLSFLYAKNIGFNPVYVHSDLIGMLVFLLPGIYLLITGVEAFITYLKNKY